MLTLRMLAVSVCMFCLAAPVISQAAGDDDPRQPVIRLFDAMRRADSAGVRSAFAPGAVLQSIGRDAAGALQVRTESIEAFAASVGKQQPGFLDERVEFQSVLTDGPMASIFTPYKFYVGGNFSHCGANSFQLVRLPEGWRIQYIIDTRRREGCD